MKETTTHLFFISILIIFVAAACNKQHKKSDGTRVAVSAPANTESQAGQSSDKLFERLMTSFSDDWMEREAAPTLYPSYYGGSFTNSDGTFVIAVTGNREEYKKQLADILGTDNFKVETVQYSYRQMMEVMDRIDAFLMNSTVSENHPLMDSFAGAYPEVRENRVKVLLTKVDDTTIRLFQRDVVNSPLIIFEQGDLPEWD